MKPLLCFFILVFSQFALAECSRPAPPALPDGATSDLETMVEGQQAVKTYVADTESYLSCITAESEAAAETETPEQQLARVEHHNEVVDEMETLAARFNEEIRKYKANAQ
jgi:hypothetical protein